MGSRSRVSRSAEASLFRAAWIDRVSCVKGPSSRRCGSTKILPKGLRNEFYGYMRRLEFQIRRLGYDPIELSSSRSGADLGALL